MTNRFKLLILCLPFNIFFCVFSVLGQNDIKVTSIQVDKLPLDIDYEGNIKDVLSWTDELGEHLIITSETGIYTSPKFAHENEGLDAELFAFHYIISKGESVQTWKIYDYIKDCPVDIEATFLKNTTKVTDLNKNGITEVWLMYKTACHGDVSPCDMKIIMYEGINKYAMRGQNKVQLSEDEFYGGDYTFDRAFKQSPKVFKEFAIDMWEKNIIQTWE